MTATNRQNALGALSAALAPNQVVRYFGQSVLYWPNKSTDYSSR